MEEAKAFAQQLMHSRGQEEERPAGDKQAGGSGLMGAAAHFLGGQGERAEEAGAADKPHEPAAGAPMLGMAQRFLGGEEAGAGDKGGAGWRGMAGQAAQSFLGHGGEGGLVGGATAEGAGKSDAGLVDKLLGLYAQHQGKQFEGKSEGEYDQLAGLANNVLGTPVGKELLKVWVKQRLGI